MAARNTLALESAVTVRSRATMTLQLRQPYRPRPVRFREIWTPGGWRIKVYGIAYGKPEPEPALVRAAKAAAQPALPPPGSPDVYDVGFLIVHEGQDGAWALLDWWAEGDLLYHHLFARPLGSDADLVPVTSGLTACVWELPVLSFERDAWVREVLAQPTAANLDAYLATTLNADV